jgi:hypothetical protein
VRSPDISQIRRLNFKEIPYLRIKVINTLADIFHRRKDMIVKFSVLAISIIYAALIALYYHTER